MPRSRSSENNKPFCLVVLGTDASGKDHVAKEFLFFKTYPFLNLLIFPVVNLFITKELQNEEIVSLAQEAFASKGRLA